MRTKVSKVLKRVYALFALFVLGCSLLFGTVINATAQTAQSAVVSYDTRSIYDDLGDLGVIPELYIKNEAGSHESIAFMEYCYSENGFIAQQYYGLYVYVYNPTGKEVQANGNVVNMATAYAGDKVSAYDNVPLKLLDATKDNLLLKFKVENAYSRFYVMEKAYAGSNEAKERRYDIAGVQLCFDTALDQTFGKTFYFSGYSSGCGVNTSAESTLSSRSATLETIELTVGHTNYRSSAYVDNVCDEINTVYFSVPKRYFEEYGKLQKIKATWEEYKTTPMFVTNDKGAYDALKSFLFTDVGNRNDALTYRVLWDEYLNDVVMEQPDASSPMISYSLHRFNNGFNRLTGGTTNKREEPLIYNNYYFWNTDVDYSISFGEEYLGKPMDDLSLMAWLFFAENAVFDEDAVNADSWRTSAEKVEAYYRETSQENKQYLFTDSIDEDRIQYLDDKTATNGRITREVDAGEERDFLVEKDTSWWNKLWHGVQYEDKGYSPIEVFKSVNDITVSTAEAFGEKYLVHKDDAETVFNFVNEELAKGNYPVLFRFAKTEFYSSAARFDDENQRALAHCNGYVAQETVFLDFEVISLTFRNDNAEETVIGVVSDPIDIINGLDAPSNIPTKDPSSGCGSDWLQTLFYVVLAIIAVFILIFLIVKFGIDLILTIIGAIFKVLFTVLWWIIKWFFIGLWFILKWFFIGLWWLITLPFIGIYYLFRWLFGLIFGGGSE